MTPEQPDNKLRRTGKDQRMRILRALIGVTGDRGYGACRVGEVAARAAVSRATFYELFADKEACFEEAHALLMACLDEQVRARLQASTHQRSLHTAITAITQAARDDPTGFIVATHQALLVGPRARTRYDQWLSRTACAIESRLDAARDPSGEPDLPARLALGAAIRICGLDVRRHGEPRPGLERSLALWLDSYTNHPITQPRRRYLRAPMPLASTPDPLPLASGPPRLLPRGRHRLPKHVVDSIQRERIACAAAHATQHRHPAAVSVADIVAAAGISREVFYGHFADKQAAYLAAHQLIFEQLIAACSSAFFKPELDWPQRIWHAGRACAALLAATPSFAHFAFIAAYGVGETGAARVDERVLGFGLFLEEGYRLAPHDQTPPRVFSDIIALGVTELAASHVRTGRTSDLPSLIPAVTYTAVAPFLGPDTAWNAIRRHIQPPAGATRQPSRLSVRSTTRTANAAPQARRMAR